MIKNKEEKDLLIDLFKKLSECPHKLNREWSVLYFLFSLHSNKSQSKHHNTANIAAENNYSKPANISEYNKRNLNIYFKVI